MRRSRVTAVVLSGVLMGSALPLRADVKTDEKSRVELAGMLGKMANIFGGKSAREGVVSSVAVKGDRKATLSEATGQIIDLREEKIYDLDLRKKSYRVTTFDELRRRMEEARKKAEEDARKESQNEKPEPADKNQKELEVDFDVKNTGEKKTINGFDTHQVVMTIAVREKGRRIEESGGLILTSDLWLTPAIAAMKEVAEFNARYARQLYGSMVSGVSAEQMATALALYPMMKDAVAKMNAEGGKLDGTSIMTTVTTQAVKSAEQMAQEQQQAREESPAASGTVGGALGGFARRMAKKKTEGDQASQPRATIFTSTHELLKVATDVAPDDVAIPAGFKENK